MASTSMQKPRRIPGAPPELFLEGQSFTYESPAPKPQPEPEPEPKPEPKEKEDQRTDEDAELEVQPDPQPKDDPKGKGKQREEAGSSISSMYGEDLPVFGRPYGFRESTRKDSSSSGLGLGGSTPTPKKKPRTKTLNPYEELLAEAEADLDRYVTGYRSDNASSRSRPKYVNHNME